MNDIVSTLDSESSDLPIDVSSVGFSQFFMMHQKINAKNEEISKSYKNPLMIKFTDIQELHTKTIQSIISLRPFEDVINVRIAVSHTEGESEKFNSFEAFETSNCTNPNPTSDLVLKYSFSTFDRDMQNLENYVVTCKVNSRIAQLSQIEKEAPAFLSSVFFSHLITTTASITIQYSDYVKARHFTAMFDEWINGCDESESIEIINKIKKYSHVISKTGIIIFIGLIGYSTVSAIDASIIDPTNIIKFLVIYASIFFIILKISEQLLRKLEISIDSYLAISYIDICKGDKKLITTFENKNKTSIKLGVFSLVLTVLTGLATSSIFEIIKYLIN
jgi:hypothetical protein